MKKKTLFGQVVHDNFQIVQAVHSYKRLRIADLKYLFKFIKTKHNFICSY